MDLHALVLRFWTVFLPKDDTDIYATCTHCGCTRVKQSMLQDEVDGLFCSEDEHVSFWQDTQW